MYGDAWRCVEICGDKTAINYLITKFIIKKWRLISLIKYNLKILITKKKFKNYTNLNQL